MLIKQELIVINNKRFIRTYSDSNKYIIQQPTNIKYGEAIDVENTHYTYIESDKDIETVLRDGETLEN